eukprot:CAMPEP_0196667310 /NCGR_PEP_ID=MMETSP1086-20130531/65010_1 /TAXON_ID=77921 /ORGANISM="Cyanoptyche  gloeocystis , Strain SAG4.97" /LENGTH=147 /DNA_ID=CAMNT_0042004627 /DNA_START=676 /DNA_END=1115 /DNA_ORIENTATION=+
MVLAGNNGPFVLMALRPKGRLLRPKGRLLRRHRCTSWHPTTFPVPPLQPSQQSRACTFVLTAVVRSLRRPASSELQLAQEASVLPASFWQAVCTGEPASLCPGCILPLRPGGAYRPDCRSAGEAPVEPVGWHCPGRTTSNCRGTLCR